MWWCIVLSAVVLMLLVWRYDMYEREPLILVALAGGLGAGVAWVAGPVEDAAIAAHPSMESVTAQALIASFTEESGKLLAVLLIALLFRWQFNDPIDGLIYGAAAGLGFGVAESALYLSLDTRQAPLLIGTEFLRLILHLLFGALTGFGVGLAWCRVPYWPLIAAASLSVSLAMHATWDRICGIPEFQPETEFYQRSVAMGIMLLGTLCFGLCVALGSWWSRVHLKVEAHHSLWGWPFVSARTSEPVNSADG